MRDAAKSMFVGCVALALLAGCETEEPQPPDPNTPLVPVTCDERAPLTLVRTAADSTQSKPHWLQLCNVCPASFDVTIDPVALHRSWSDGGTCVVAMPSDPWPEADVFEASALIDDGTRTATFDFEHAGSGERGDEADDLGSATYRLPLTAGALRTPALLAADLDTDLLVQFERTADHGFQVNFGRTSSGSTQDLCTPTTTLAAHARSDAGQIGAALAEGDELPLPLLAPLKGGALQATLSSTGSALRSMALLVDVDADLLEGDAETLCADYEAQVGEPLCGPCGDPALEPDGNTCITFVWEWSTATRVPDPLVQVDVPSEDCADPS